MPNCSTRHNGFKFKRKLEKQRKIILFLKEQLAYYKYSANLKKYSIAKVKQVFVVSVSPILTKPIYKFGNNFPNKQPFLNL